MFFRAKPSGPRRYLQLVENTRDGTATRQRVLATLGRIDDAADRDQAIDDAVFDILQQRDATQRLIDGLDIGLARGRWGNHN